MFLRSNVGSKSGGRSRASPMFLRKVQKSSGSSVGAGESTQEPSSPKVTCIGQVRVGRSKKPRSRRPGRELDAEGPSSCTGCAWFSHSLLCNCPTGNRWKRSKSNSRGDLWLLSSTCPWRDCPSLFQVAGRRRRRANIREAQDSQSSKAETELRSRNNRVSIELREGDHPELRSKVEDEGAEAGASTCVASSSPRSPPKNALLLTRCRSAPYRSSSLACKFWESPLSGAGEAQAPQQNGEESAGEEPKPLLAPEAESRVHPEEEEAAEPPAADDGEKARFLEEEITASVTEKAVKPAKNGELNLMEEGGLRQPPRLTRCKSEPARTAALKVGIR